MISVIMGVHAVDEYLIKSIDSILKQSLKEFEFIIVANGRDCDAVYDYIRLNFNDDRIVLLKSSIGQLAYSLNLAIDNSKYDYIARMDSDDVSYSNRLEKQLHFLQLNSLDIIGSDIRLIDENDTHLSIRKYPKGAEINKKLPFKNCFAHNTMFFKKSIVIDARGYNAGFNSEDYDLWLRLKRLGVAWDNMDEVLLDYRIHSEATQRRLLGYAEVTGYAMREFILNKNISNLFAIFYFFIKSLTRSR